MESTAWISLLDSGEMSEKQRADFAAWLEEPRNKRALSEFRSLLLMIQDLPEEKSAALRHLPLVDVSWRRDWTKPLALITIASGAVSVGVGALLLSWELFDILRDWLWPGYHLPGTAYIGLELAMSVGSFVAGSLLGATVFRQVTSK